VLAGGALTAASAARSALAATRDEDGAGGNQAFALGAALITSIPLMRVGEIATVLGALDTDLVQGLDAGALRLQPGLRARDDAPRQPKGRAGRHHPDRARQRAAA
jgi:hypothetical protein